MKRRILIIIIMSVFVISGIFGGIKRTTYTDITKKDDYLDNLDVAELHGDKVQSCCQDIPGIIPDVHNIVKGKVTGEVEHLFHTSRQKILVEKVFKGNAIQEGSEIYVYSNFWGISLEIEPPSIGRGFVNIMDMNEEYLIFLQDVVVNADEDLPVYQIYEDILITPVFAYKNKEEKIVKPGTENTYVPYSSVSGNELFCDSEEGFEAWNNLKERLFQEYN